MRFTTQAEYGLICSLHLARHAQRGPVAAREMAEIENLPGDYTEKILRRLRQAGLVTAVRGVSGGFQLTHDCSIRPVWLALRQRIDELLSDIRLSALLEEREAEISELIDITWGPVEETSAPA
jgi:DNA-binding IscR family transcriptional regulator